MDNGVVWNGVLVYDGVCGCNISELSWAGMETWIALLRCTPSKIEKQVLLLSQHSLFVLLHFIHTIRLCFSEAEVLVSAVGLSLVYVALVMTVFHSVLW